MKCYYQKQVCAGYGAYVFVPVSDLTPEGLDLLSKSAMWGGATKSNGLTLGWEFTPDALSPVLEALEAYGFSAEEINETNHMKVWP